jgi:hypothetical protein
MAISTPVKFLWLQNKLSEISFRFTRLQNISFSFFACCLEDASLTLRLLKFFLLLLLLPTL